MTKARFVISLLLFLAWLSGAPAHAATKPRIAIVSGPIATIQNGTVKLTEILSFSRRKRF